MAGDNGSSPQLTRAQLDAIDSLASIPEFAQAARRFYSKEATPPPQVTPDSAFLELPKEAALPAELGRSAGSFIDDYIAYADAISPMTPVHFHESAALWLASVAIARRLVLRMAFGDIYPNLFIIWVAPTTLYRKSTALNIARNMARECFPHLMAAQETTPESLFSDMAGYQPANYATMSVEEQQDWNTARNFAAQKGMVYDEMSGLMAGAGKDYNAGLLEGFMRFYDCDPYFDRSTRGQGRVVVKNAYLSILGASTPAGMRGHFTSRRIWDMGWWPRFATLAPAKRPDWAVARRVDKPAALIQNLIRLFQRLPCAKWPEAHPTIDVTLGTGVHDALERYTKALTHDLINDDLNEWLYGTYGRLPTQAMKVATILAALDWTDAQPAPRIELPHLARALAITEGWRLNAHRNLELATATDFDKFKERILRQAGKYMPAGITMRDLCKALKDKTPQEIEMATEQLILAGEIELVKSEPGPKGGRPTERFILVTE